MAIYLREFNIAAFVPHICMAFHGGEVRLNVFIGMFWRGKRLSTSRYQGLNGHCIAKDLSS
jgi:hypothetical protein